MSFSLGDCAPLHRKGDASLEVIVETLHEYLQSAPKYAWCYPGGKAGKALIRGQIFQIRESSEKKDSEFIVNVWLKALNEGTR